MLDELRRFGPLVHDRSTDAGLWLGVAALGSIACMSFVGTLSRYLLGMPIAWVTDWSGYLLAAAIFLAAPAVTRARGHVAIDALRSLLGPAGGRRLDAAINLVAAATLAAMCWIVWQSLAAAYRDGTGTAAGFPIPRWWLLSLVLYGFLSSSLHFLRFAMAPAATAAAPEVEIRSAA